MNVTDFQAYRERKAATKAGTAPAPLQSPVHPGAAAPARTEAHPERTLKCFKCGRLYSSRASRCHYDHVRLTWLDRLRPWRRLRRLLNGVFRKARL